MSSLVHNTFTTQQFVLWLDNLPIPNLERFIQSVEAHGLTPESILNSSEDELQDILKLIPPESVDNFNRKLTQLLSPQNTPFQLNVSIRDGESQVFPRGSNLTEEMTAADIRKILAEHDPKFTDCALFFRDRKLSDDETLGSRGIIHQSQIVAALRVRGGGVVENHVPHFRMDSSARPPKPLDQLNRVSELEMVVFMGDARAAHPREIAISRGKRCFGAEFRRALDLERIFLQLYNPPALLYDHVVFDLNDISIRVTEFFDLRSNRCISYIFHPESPIACFELNDDDRELKCDVDSDFTHAVVKYQSETDSTVEDAVFVRAIILTYANGGILILASFPFDREHVYIFRNGSFTRVDRWDYQQFLTQIAHDHIIHHAEVVEAIVYDGQINPEFKVFIHEENLEVVVSRGAHGANQWEETHFCFGSNGEEDILNAIADQALVKLEFRANGDYNSAVVLASDDMRFHLRRVGTNVHDFIDQPLVKPHEEHGTSEMRMYRYSKLLCETGLCIHGAAVSTRHYFGGSFDRKFRSYDYFCDTVYKMFSERRGRRVSAGIEEICTASRQILAQIATLGLKSLYMFGHRFGGSHPGPFHINPILEEQTAIENAVNYSGRYGGSLVLVAFSSNPDTVNAFHAGHCQMLYLNEVREASRGFCRAPVGTEANGVKVFCVHEHLNGKVLYGVRDVESVDDEDGLNDLTRFDDVGLFPQSV